MRIEVSGVFGSWETDAAKREQNVRVLVFHEQGAVRPTEFAARTGEDGECHSVRIGEDTFSSGEEEKSRVGVDRKRTDRSEVDQRNWSVARMPGQDARTDRNVDPFTVCRDVRDPTADFDESMELPIAEATDLGLVATTALTDEQDRFP